MMTSQPELRGPELLRAAVNHIIDHPETWNQHFWHCGTTHCIAGHCQIMAGLLPDYGNIHSKVRELLELSETDAYWLFSSNRTLPEIHKFAFALLHPEDYDKDGYDQKGYDRRGYNRAGRDRDDYDQAGYNRDGQQLPKL